MKRPIAALFVFAILSPSARALDYEKSVAHDRSCIIEAFDAEGDIYMRCKGVKGTLKTTVETPVVSEMIRLNSDLKEATKQAKRQWIAQANWALLQWAFASQNRVLITLNENKTLITKVTAFTGEGFRPGVSF